MKEKKRRILVLGYFGYQNNQLDGQTIKTRNVYELLELYGSDNFLLSHFDTQDFQYNKSSLLRMLKLLMNCDSLVYLPAQNNLTYIFPFIYVLSLVKRFDILYIVIGGWLSSYLKNKRIHRYMLSHIKGIFLENSSVYKEMKERYSLQNVYISPNFRIHSFAPLISSNQNQFRVVFMSRIMLEKGIDTVFLLARKLSEKYMEGQVIIDFYGQIAEKDKIYFEEQVRENSIISYKGELAPAEIYQTLTTYDLLILPTKYMTEGFPGAILDAYISGIPVIVSNWNNSREYVDNGKTGYICDVNNVNEFYDKIEYLYMNRSLLEQMKVFAYEKSKEFHADKIWEQLKCFLIEEK
ncbi:MULTISPECIES: glycosyltransferase [unclassified Bacteroides]|jgi:glycosyltransferase involved in cell wall biosynthesis|uniref:glycosyltransferase n=1 Tax=unclassified Bacteroides TaxID=2646097 RepID=UPI000E85E6B4|nr:MULTISPECIES: glycosyltransferase [unclassified Bacteroides]RGN50783.1 glycosyltransferase [Bacteroides sp. OM05-12]RHR76607.1 glycosyltransferase [Bacteroides sp. AF16-49]